MVAGFYHNSDTGDNARVGFNTEKARWEVNENGVRVYERTVNRLEKRGI